MSTKVFNTRLQLKYAPYSEWSAEANQFKLLAGEIAIVSVPAETGAVVSEPSILFKVGDGEKTFNQLPWASGLAADVYGWAKKEHGEASDIIVKDTANNFVGTDVEAVLAEIWGEVKALTGGEEGAGSVASQIKNGIDAFAATLGTAAKANVEDFDAAGTAAGLIKDLTDSLGTAAYEAKEAFDVAGTGAAEAAKVLGTSADVAGTATVHGALKSAAAAAKAGTDAADVVDGKLTEYKTSNDAALAGVKATADAAAVKADVNAAFEGVNATIATLATKADVEASFEAVNGEIDEAIEAINTEAATHAKQTDLEAEIDRATKAEAKALADAKAYADGIKSDLLGESETLEGTYDTLKEIAGWISTHEGETVVELTTAIADEAKAREEADADFETRVSALEGKVDVDKVSDAIAAGVAGEATLRETADTALSNRIKDLEDNKAGYATTAQVATAKQEAIDAAAADATSKADAAEANVKAYTDEKIGDLHTVATSGKIEDLDQEVEYIIFNCGTATTLVSEPVTE